MAKKPAKPLMQAVGCYKKMLSKEQNNMWNQYRQAEKDRIRSVFLPALDKFVSSLNLGNINSWKSFAYEIARKHVDEKDNFPIRFPLFLNVIFPALLHGLNNNEPNCARWLAGFTQLIYHRKECQEALGKTGWSKQDLLRKAIEQDPGDALAKEELIKSIESYLDYTLHELPTGVLYDQNGADAEKCEELNSLLSEFIELVKSGNNIEKFSELIQECQFHYYHYPLYLSKHKKYGSYELYLERHEAQKN